MLTLLNRILVATFLLLSGTCAGLSQTRLVVSGDIVDVHDPTVIKEKNTFYLFSTRAGISVRCSTDLLGWRLCGDVFGHLPRWAVEDVPGVRGLWAPDISYFNGKFHLYYSVSTFGSNRSSIGLATNQTLDRSNPRFRWEDRGKVISSSSADDWNAIDPNLVIDEKGEPWLSFGSFWGGIKLRKIDPLTGLLSKQDETLYALASRPRTEGQPGAVEAPFIFHRNNFYYLFVSFDFCCRGKDSSYNIRVGRSRQVTGPYFDREGVAMSEGGGTLVLAGHGRWRGPGHCTVLPHKAGDLLIYHAYDADRRGASTLRIDRLFWDAEGWPRVGFSLRRGVSVKPGVERSGTPGLRLNTDPRARGSGRQPDLPQEFQLQSRPRRLNHYSDGHGRAGM